MFGAAAVTTKVNAASAPSLGRDMGTVEAALASGAETARTILDSD